MDEIHLDEDRDQLRVLKILPLNMDVLLYVIYRVYIIDLLTKFNIPASSGSLIKAIEWNAANIFAGPPYCYLT
jgi:hypothetical protein